MVKCLENYLYSIIHKDQKLSVLNPIVYYIKFLLRNLVIQLLIISEIKGKDICSSCNPKKY